MCPALDAQTARVEAVRFWSFGDVTRIAIQTQGEYKLLSDQIPSPPRVYFDFTGLRPPLSVHRRIQTIQVHDKLVKELRIAEVSPGRTRIVFDLEAPVDVVSSQLVNPDRLMIELRPKPATAESAPRKAATEVAEVRPPADAPPLTVQSPARIEVPALQPQQAPPADQVAVHETAVPILNARPLSKNSGAHISRATDPSLVRVFGLKLGRVVIDAGHGGHDTGTIGPNGLQEKDLVLDVAQRLGRLIVQRMGADVVYTRSGDVFIPLEDRTKIANQEKADLFISIHANSSPESSATGVETYYFNLTSDRRGLDLAMRENATASSSISDLSDLLHRAVLETKMEESREFAQSVQNKLWTQSMQMNAQSRNRGVRQAPFVVLIGATMPSILAEIGFVSNPHDARLLKRNDQRQRIAEALYRGIAQYASTLSHANQIARAGS
jgi:N-acetylmuramoyl-L-alanine amidase